MKTREIVLYILLIIVIILSFFLPRFVLKIKQNSFFNKEFSYMSNTIILDKNKEIPQIIKTIYSKYNNNQKYTVETEDYTFNIEETVLLDKEELLFNTLQELTNIGIINNNLVDEIKSSKQITLRILDYDNSEIKYRTMKIFTDKDNFKNSIGSIDFENEDEKVIQIKFDKRYVNTDIKVLEKYIKYLELENLSDWQYSNLKYTSEKGQVKIEVLQDEEYTKIRIVPIQYEN